MEEISWDCLVCKYGCVLWMIPVLYRNISKKSTKLPIVQKNSTSIVHTKRTRTHECAYAHTHAHKHKGSPPPFGLETGTR